MNNKKSNRKNYWLISALSLALSFSIISTASANREGVILRNPNGILEDVSIEPVKPHLIGVVNDAGKRLLSIGGLINKKPEILEIDRDPRSKEQKETEEDILNGKVYQEANGYVNRENFDGPNEEGNVELNIWPDEKNLGFDKEEALFEYSILPSLENIIDQNKIDNLARKVTINESQSNGGKITIIVYVEDCELTDCETIEKKDIIERIWYHLSRKGSESLSLIQSHTKENEKITKEDVEELRRIRGDTPLTINRLSVNPLLFKDQAAEKEFRKFMDAAANETGQYIYREGKWEIKDGSLAGHSEPKIEYIWENTKKPFVEFKLRGSVTITFIKKYGNYFILPSEEKIGKNKLIERIHHHLLEPKTKTLNLTIMEHDIQNHEKITQEDVEELRNKLEDKTLAIEKLRIDEPLFFDKDAVLKFKYLMREKKSDGDGKYFYHEKATGDKHKYVTINYILVLPTNKKKQETEDTNSNIQDSQDEEDEGESEDEDTNDENERPSDRSISSMFKDGWEWFNKAFLTSEKNE